MRRFETSATALRTRCVCSVFGLILLAIVDKNLHRRERR